MGRGTRGREGHAVLRVADGTIVVVVFLADPPEDLRHLHCLDWMAVEAAIRRGADREDLLGLVTASRLLAGRLETVEDDPGA